MFLSAEKDSIEKRLEVLSTWTRVAPEIATAEVESARIADQMSALGKETNDASESLERLAREKDSLRVISEEAARARIVVQHLRAWEQVRSLESEKASLEAVLADLHRRLYDYATTDADLKGVAWRLEETKEEIALHRQTERELLGDESRLKTELEHCVDAERRASEAGEKLAEVDARITVCEVLSDAYERVPFYILDNVLPIMEDEANKVLEEISDSGMRIELRTERPNKTNANVDDKLLDIIVSDMAGEGPIELYSGGEKTRQIRICGNERNPEQSIRNDCSIHLLELVFLCCNNGCHPCDFPEA